MSSVMVSLADEDLAFLKKYSEAHGTSVGEFLARQARSLRKQLEQPLPPEIVSASGIINGAVDSQAEYLKHMEAKHQ